jgi:hypothetical protein
MSGAVVLPPQCAGLSAKVCFACLATAGAGDCLACAKDARAAKSVAPVAYVAGSGSQAQGGCVACAAVGDAAKRKQ